MNDVIVATQAALSFYDARKLTRSMMEINLTDIEDFLYEPNISRLFTSTNQHLSVFRIWLLMDCILQPGEDGKGGLFLGSIGAANNAAWHKSCGIKGILSIIKLSNYIQFKFDMKDGQIVSHKHV